MTTWTRIDFGVNVKLHAVSAALREALLANMAARNHVPTATFDHSDWQIEKPITEWCLDLGGGVFTGEPFVDVTVDDLVVSCRAYQLEAVIKRCRKFEPTRMFATGQAYHKIHTWPAHSLVVTPCQYAAVIDGLTACIPEANARLTAFEAAQDAIRDQVRGLGPAPQPCCAICQLPQVETPSGRSCPNGHGGAPSLEVL